MRLETEAEIAQAWLRPTRGVGGARSGRRRRPQAISPGETPGKAQGVVRRLAARSHRAGVWCCSARALASAAALASGRRAEGVFAVAPRPRAGRRARAEWTCPDAPRRALKVAPGTLPDLRHDARTDAPSGVEPSSRRGARETARRRRARAARRGRSARGRPAPIRGRPFEIDATAASGCAGVRLATAERAARQAAAIRLPERRAASTSRAGSGSAPAGELRPRPLRHDRTGQTVRRGPSRCSASAARTWLPAVAGIASRCRRERRRSTRRSPRARKASKAATAGRGGAAAGWARWRVSDGSDRCSRHGFGRNLARRSALRFPGIVMEKAIVQGHARDARRGAAPSIVDPSDPGLENSVCEPDLGAVARRPARGLIRLEGAPATDSGGRPRELRRAGSRPRSRGRRSCEFRDRRTGERQAQEAGMFASVDLSDAGRPRAGGARGRRARLGAPAARVRVEAATATTSRARRRRQQTVDGRRTRRS